MHACPKKSQQDTEIEEKGPWRRMPRGVNVKKLRKGSLEYEGIWRTGRQDSRGHGIRNQLRVAKVCVLGRKG